MKKTSKRVLRLSLETVRTLRGDHLAKVIAGCDTTSYTTEGQTSAHTEGATQVHCTQKV